ncbi:MAG: hypothetical protein QW514_03365 [Thermoprotei archaeon]
MSETFTNTPNQRAATATNLFLVFSPVAESLEAGSTASHIGNDQPTATTAAISPKNRITTSSRTIPMVVFNPTPKKLGVEMSSYILNRGFKRSTARSSGGVNIRLKRLFGRRRSPASP